MMVRTLLPVIAGILWLAGAPGPAQAQGRGTCIGPAISVSPALTDLGADEYVRLGSGPTGFTGGLYPDGSNVPPRAHVIAGRSIARQITPLDEQGRPDPAGKIVLISVGMSNTSSEFNTFMGLVGNRGDANPRLFLVNGAQDGRTAERWVDPQSAPWYELDRRLARYQVTPQQVQVAWIKQTLTRGGEFPAKAEQLQADLAAIVRNLKVRYPNIKIAYLSSRTRAYTYWRGLSPEPLAFETGFAVKWLIEQQIEGDPALNYDPARGPVRAPYLSWGPYLWSNGVAPRSDGTTWLATDLMRDCTHPSVSGRRKVAEMLVSFFSSDATSVDWFLAGRR
jgi:hypothetical protein